MQLIREDVSEEATFALGLKVGLGQRAGKRAPRREPGNLGMVVSSLAAGGALAAPSSLLVEGLESFCLWPLYFKGFFVKIKSQETLGSAGRQGPAGIGWGDRVVVLAVAGDRDSDCDPVCDHVTVTLTVTLTRKRDCGGGELRKETFSLGLRAWRWR